MNKNVNPEWNFDKLRGTTTLSKGGSWETREADRRITMPKGGYVYGRSNPRLRPDVPKGQ